MAPPIFVCAIERFSEAADRLGDEAAFANPARGKIFHALRHRHVGRDHWVDFHLVVPRSWDIARGHEVATAIEIELQEALGHSDPATPGWSRATAHVEPCGGEGCQRCTAASG